jgi:hypothetical protein
MAKTQNGELSVTDEQIEDYVVKLMKNNPAKFVQYALLVIGKDIFKTNASEFKFSQEADLEKGRRFKISVKGTIKEIFSAAQ